MLFTSQLQYHAGGTVIGRHSNAMMALEHLPQLGAEAVVKPGVQEGVTAGGAHGTQVAQQLDEQKVTLVNEVNVNVSQHVEHVNRKPAHRKGRHQESDQAKDLSFASLLSACLVLRPVAWSNAVPQFDSDAEIRDKNSRKREDVSNQQGAVRISTSFFFLTQPELLTDSEAFLFEFNMIGVGHCWSYQATRQKPDPSKDRGTGRHRGPLLQGVNCCIISAMNKE